MKFAGITITSTFVMVIFFGLTGCLRQQTQASPELVPMAQVSDTPSDLAGSPQPSLTQVLTPNPTPSPRPEITQAIDIPQPERNLLPTSTVAAIDPAVVAAQVEAISDALSRGDITVFRDMAAERVGFGLYKSEIWDYYSRSEFLHEVSLRLDNHPVCLNYTFYTYSFTPDFINVSLFVFIDGWDPEWDLAGVRQSDTVVFDLITHNGEDFVLTGAYLHNDPLPYGDIPCP